MNKTMLAAFLPGDSTVALREVPIPRPQHGEVLIRMKASTICGSDIRCIYREHLGAARKVIRALWLDMNRAGRSRIRGRVAAGSRAATGSSFITFRVRLCHDCRAGT